MWLSDWLRTRRSRAARPDEPIVGDLQEASAGDGRPPALPERKAHRSTGEWLPEGVRGAAAWSGAALLIGLVIYLVAQFAVTLGLLVLTLFIGLLLTALLRPVADWLDRVGLPRLATTWLLVLGVLALFLGSVWFIEQRLRSQLPTLEANLTNGLDRVRNFLVERVGLSPEQVDALFDGAINSVRGATGSASGGVGGTFVTAATTLAAVLAGLALALFTAFWLIYDGDRVWHFLVRLLPARWRGAADRAGGAAWEVLGSYLRGVTLVALVDAVGIGIALLALGVPIAFTLGVLTFFGAYVPLVGAFVAGLVAVLVAFAAHGLTTALLVLGAVVLVQQLEGQLLQPIIMGRSVAVHPLAIVYAIAAGGLLWGISGAILAVPLLAAAYSVGKSLSQTGATSGPREGEEVADEP
jgi:predicted PurR-regulated permease PerM